VNAIASRLGGEVGAIVHQNRHAAGLGNRDQDLGHPPDLIIVDVLQADLQASHVVGIDGCGERLGEGRQFDARWRHEIEAAGGGRHAGCP